MSCINFALIASISLSAATALSQSISLSESESEVVSRAIDAGAIDQPTLLLDIESDIRVFQESLYSNLFEENTEISEIYDYLSSPVNLSGSKYGNYNGIAITHDDRLYSVEGALVFSIDISVENDYPEEWEDFATTNDMLFYTIYGTLTDFSTGNSAFFYGLIAQSDAQDASPPMLIALSELETATQEQMTVVSEATYEYSSNLLAFPSCVDTSGNLLEPDAEYDICRAGAFDRYSTDMDDRIRRLTNGGGLGILIYSVAGTACIAFPPSCPIAVPVAIAAGIYVLYEGQDAFDDFHDNSSGLGFNIRECCRELQLRNLP